MNEFLIFYYIFFFIFGLMIGSFLNALIYRLPRKINIALPRSSCPSCKKLIYWYENIPVLSFIFLKGKCSKCKNPISIRYPIVELLVGVASLLIAPNELTSHSLWNYFFFFSVFCAFVVHFLVDIEHQILPDSVTIYLALLFLASSILTQHWIFYVSGALIGFGLTYLVTWLFYVIQGKVGLGGGDIKLFGALGIYLGPQGIIHNLFFSCMLGSVVGITLILVGKMDRQSKLAFGPYIIIAALLQIFFKETYQKFIGQLF